MQQQLIEPQKVKNIIFDMGNVLFDIDIPAIKHGFRQLFGEQSQSAMNHLNEQKIFTLYETGGLSTDEFVDAIRFAGDTPLEAAAVIAVWNSIFIDFPKARLDMLLELRRRYQVFMLSNINDLHARWIDDFMLQTYGIDNFHPIYFDAVYYSHLIRLRKPERESYEYVLADAEIKPEESVFIDDLEENIVAAQSVGIQGIWHPAGTDITERMRIFLS